MAVLSGDSAPSEPINVPGDSACVMFVNTNPTAELSNFSNFEAIYTTEGNVLDNGMIDLENSY